MGKYRIPYNFDSWDGYGDEMREWGRQERDEMRDERRERERERERKERETYRERERERGRGKREREREN